MSRRAYPPCAYSTRRCNGNLVAVRSAAWLLAPQERKVLDARSWLWYHLGAFVALVGPFAFEVKGCKVALAAVLFSA